MHGGLPADPSLHGDDDERRLVRAAIAAMRAARPRHARYARRQLRTRRGGLQIRRWYTLARTLDWALNQALAAHADGRSTPTCVRTA